MNKLTLLAVFILNLVFYAHSAPTNTAVPTLLDALNDTERYEQYKCPYLRTTFLNHTFYPFLKSCPGTLQPRGNGDILCVVFYNNFLKLCNISSGQNLKMLINESTISASFNTESACKNLQDFEAVSERFNETLRKVQKILDGSCPVLCENLLEDKTLSICAISGLMNNVIKQFMLQEKVLKEKMAGKIENVDKNAPGKVIEDPKVDLKSQIDNKSEVKSKSLLPDNKVETQNEPKTQNVDNNQNIDKKQNNQDNPDNNHQNDDKTNTNVNENKPSVVETPKKPDETVQNVPEVNNNDNKEVKKPSEDVTNEKNNQNVDNHEDKDHREEAHEEANVQKGDRQEKVDGKEVKNNNEEIKPDIPPKNDETELNFDENPNEQENKFDMNSEEDQFDNENELVVNHQEEPKKKPSNSKPKELNEDDIIPANVNNSGQLEEEDSFFFVYFMMVCAVFILGYIGYHNKQKVLALVIEGRRGRRTSRRGGRPNSANYHKLDSNLEEAVTSSVHKNTTNIIY